MPNSDAAFHGDIGMTTRESTPCWPQRATAATGAPNIVVVVLDDVGYGQLGCYGGLIETPSIDQMAKEGLRYNNFHTCSLCSPSRASMLTGRNPHRVGFGAIAEMPLGYPAYNGRIPRQAATVATHLLRGGYNTFAVGKWHNTAEDETSAVGPYDRWPQGLGFERFYGFMGAAADQWEPLLYQDTHWIDAPKRADYHLSEDLVDRAIGYIGTQKAILPDSPFFLWLAFGAAHAPHQAPASYIEKYAGRFDGGWDEAREEIFARQLRLGIVPSDCVLNAGNPEIQRWEDLTRRERRLFARMQEVFAGFLDHCDAQIGRLKDFLKDLGVSNNTLTVVVSDNGASAEGGLMGTTNYMRRNNGLSSTLRDNEDALERLGGRETSGHYPAGWAQAGNTPFKWFKHFVHFGGIRDPLIMHWPAGIRDIGEIRSQFHHAVDIAPTLLDVAQIEPADVVEGYLQYPIDGVSMVYTFADSAVPSRRRIQHFEVLGNRGIYHQGWSAVTFHGWLPWEQERHGRDFEEEDRDLQEWELYHVDRDFSQSRDLSTKYPDRLRDMVTLWWVEAARCGVLPLNAHSGLAGLLEGRPSPNRDRPVFQYQQGAVIAGVYAPDVRNRSHRITARLELRSGRNNGGVVCSMGGRLAGYSVYISRDGRLVYCHNFFGTRYRVESTESVPAGSFSIAVYFKKLGEHCGQVRLLIDSREVGEGTVEHTVPTRYSWGQRFEVGRNSGSAVDEAYESPFEIDGLIEWVRVELDWDGLISEADDVATAQSLQ